MEYLDKIVVIIIWWPTCPPEDGRRAVQLVKEHLKTTMPRKKNYTNHHHQEVNFLVEDQVYLQATSLKRTKHFHVKRNSHQDLSTFSKITARRRIDGYQLELPPEPPTMHKIFHESQLRKCFQHPNQPDPYKDIDHRAIDLQPNMTYARDPKLQPGPSRTSYTKPRHWVHQGSMKHHSEAQAVWGREDYPQVQFLYSFPRLVWESRGRDSCKGGRSVTPWFSCHNT